ncbi:MAG: glycoside hydrolase family 97 protein [Calditrichaceae bacterium]
MHKTVLFLFCFNFLFASANTYTIKSPNQDLTLIFNINDSSELEYQLFYKNKTVIEPSRLIIDLKDQPDFRNNFIIAQIDSDHVDLEWQPVWGQLKSINNTYNEFAVTLKQTDINDRKMILRFRLFDDGLGFRYEFPRQDALQYFIIADELTQFNLTDDHTLFWLPGDYDSNEHTYATTPMSEVDATRGLDAIEISTRMIYADNAVQTPLMIKTTDSLYVNIHEAALVDYPAMQLLVDKEEHILTSIFAPDAVGNDAFLQTPAQTPWRTIIVSDKAEDILASKLILNLNEPCKLDDVSWIKPQKYIGIWWGMHVGTMSWNYSDIGNIKLDLIDWSKLEPSGRHGATTENTKRYIDFAAEHGFDAVLVEGWNIGWEDWFGTWKENVFDFVTPYPDFNIDELQTYAAHKKLKLIMHHETASSVTNYERRMDNAYSFMKKYGYNTVKTGYVGKIIPRGEFHDGQWMVNHYARVAEKTAEYKIMVNMHESARPTGMHRTFPNWLACEAARGNEFNAWSSGNPPEHETILPFTRLMGGPMDYTPGIFQITMDYYGKTDGEQVHTTLAKQLALYVTMYSPLQMAADLPENYEKHMDAFQFIKDVPVDWDDTKILTAEPGDYITIARKAKNSENWFVGSITDENTRDMNISLDFLNPKTKYIASIYRDAKDAHWKKNPMKYEIDHFLVDSKTVLKLRSFSCG